MIVIMSFLFSFAFGWYSSLCCMVVYCCSKTNVRDIKNDRYEPAKTIHILIGVILLSLCRVVCCVYVVSFCLQQCYYRYRCFSIREKSFVDLYRSPLACWENKRYTPSHVLACACKCRDFTRFNCQWESYTYTRCTNTCAHRPRDGFVFVPNMHTHRHIIATQTCIQYLYTIKK